MKKLSMIALLALALALALALSTGAGAATVQVKIDGVANDRGVVQVALCDEANFLGQCKITASAPARAGAVTIDLPDVPAGTWAVLAYHDVNSNKKLDTNFVGMPTEGYGFSNGAKGSFGPPKFKAAAITVGEGMVPAIVVLKY